MGLAVSEDHDLLSSVARTLLEERYPNVARDSLETDPADLPLFWKEAAELGWMGFTCPKLSAARDSESPSSPSCSKP